MKVGIITFINTINFGASLQAFALQEKIKDLGGNAEIIQYTNKIIEEKEKNTGKKINIKKIIRQLIMGNGIREKTEAFKKFEEKNFCKGLKLEESTVDKVNDYYDLFVTGSDQVWNMAITHYDWNYFLEFVHDSSKKVSYAPSFGNDKFPEDAKKKARVLLQEFEYLSVREESGKRLINELGLNAKVVADPTLLLDKNEWENKVEFKPEIEDYILVYFPHNKKKVFDFVKKLQKKTKLKVIYLSISPKIQRGVTTIYNASPEEFLGWIKNAKYVVTGSFHGTVFSLNLEKQFFYEPSGSGSRIDNIVKITGTESRSIDNPNVTNEMIDFDEVRPKINQIRKESYEFLKIAINKKENNNG